MSENLNTVFKSFISEIIKVFPEYEERLLKTYYNNNFEDENVCEDKLSDFMKNIESISQLISTNDLTVFDKDPILLENVSIKVIWKSDISTQTKNSLWRYLQTFCILHIKNNQNDERVSDVMESIKQNEKVKDKETVKNMKKLKKLTELINEDVIKEGIESSDMEQMGNLFENTQIGQIAKEVTEELNIEEMLSNENGSGGIEQLFNGGNMMNIIQTISSKVGSLENEGNGNNIMEEAMNITNTMKGNPIFTTLMEGMGVEESDLNTRSNPVVRDDIIVKDTSHTSSQTRKRLQQKLKEKTENTEK